MAADQPARPQEDAHVLIELQQTLARAWLSHDRTAIEQIIAPEWRSTGPDGRGSDRAQVLADVFDSGAHAIRELTIDDVRVRQYGDAAVVTGRTHGIGAFLGEPYDVVIRFTDMFIWRDQRWCAVASHASLEAMP